MYTFVHNHWLKNSNTSALRTVEITSCLTATEVYLLIVRLLIDTVSNGIR